MTLFTRLRYALYLAIISSAAISLFVVLASADAVGLLPSRAFDLLFSPLFILAVYVVSFVLSPWASERFPINRSER
jgi:hypothetical protein